MAIMMAEPRRRSWSNTSVVAPSDTTPGVFTAGVDAAVRQGGHE